MNAYQKVEVRNGIIQGIMLLLYGMLLAYLNIGFWSFTIIYVATMVISTHGYVTGVKEQRANAECDNKDLLKLWGKNS